MDNEDSSPISTVSGWTGAITLEANRNTNLGFCRVDGSRFRSHPYADFAVLSLDTSCPAASVRISRLFDNENTKHSNGHQGNIYPNVSSADTLLYFCVFRASGVMLSEFPNFQAPYGVFSSLLGTTSYGGEARALATGVVFTDDEDSNNQDSGYVPDIIHGSDGIGLTGRNSYLKVAQVRNDPIPNCIYGGSLAGPNCKILAFQNPQVIPGISYWVDADPRWPGVYYAQVNGGCPYGGSVSGPNCAVVSLPPGKLTQGVAYGVATDPRWPGIYYAPINGGCPYGGEPGVNCRVMAFTTPAQYVVQGINYGVATDPRWPGVYYPPIDGGCPYGGEPGVNCRLVAFPVGKVVPGVNYWVDTSPLAPGVYYFEPLSSPPRPPAVPR
ncbi:hypothetical protein, partial [Stigmatella aurantiaca]|uniref:hypothetical protein n=1 Tax=Stigmatella aurantiaca TaxID=41 RepID=UPI00055F6129